MAILLRPRPPAGQATVRNLITHTSGLGYWFWSEDLVRWEKRGCCPNIAAGSSASFSAPLLGDPGEAFTYGSIDWLGKVVEAVTGVGLDVAIKEGITGPLGIDQTTFLMDDDQRPNSTPVTSRARTAPGCRSARCWTRPRTTGRRHGLYGPPSDYIKFEQALLRGGDLAAPDLAAVHGGRGLPQPDRRPRVPRRPSDRRPGVNLHVPRGARLQVGLRAAAQHHRHPGHAARMVRGWAGLCNTQFWIDRTTGVCASIYSNSAVRDPRGCPAVRRLRKGALRSSLTRPRRLRRYPSAVIIRPATEQDWPLIYPFYGVVMAEGKTYPFPAGQTLEGGPALVDGSAARADGRGCPRRRDRGLREKGANRPGRGSHVATAPPSW